MASAPQLGSFDRAAEYYDRTRDLGETATAEIVDLPTRELPGGRACLEIGVGTGRIALPLAGRGMDLTGIDLSEGMMRKLVDKAGGRSAVPLVRADARSLPFRERSFGGALAVHVLHLIDDWRAVLRELRRVVVPGGVFVTSFTPNQATNHESLFGALADRFRRAAGLPLTFPGTTTEEEVDAAMRELGAAVRPLSPVRAVLRIPPGEIVDRLAEGLYSFTWPLEEGPRRRAAEAVRAWAAESYGSLEEPVADVWEVRWRAYDLPGETT